MQEKICQLMSEFWDSDILQIQSDMIFSCHGQAIFYLLQFNKQINKYNKNKMGEKSPECFFFLILLVRNKAFGMELLTVTMKLNVEAECLRKGFCTNVFFFSNEMGWNNNIKNHTHTHPHTHTTYTNNSKRQNKIHKNIICHDINQVCYESGIDYHNRLTMN